MKYIYIIEYYNTYPLFKDKKTVCKEIFSNYGAARKMVERIRNGILRFRKADIIKYRRCE